MQSGQFARMKYQHPDITKKRISFAVSIENDIYVECYTFHDLMSICNLNGDLICNIYGPSWDSKESNRVHHYGDVIFCKDKILAVIASPPLRFPRGRCFTYILRLSLISTAEPCYATCSPNLKTSATEVLPA